MLSKPVSEHAKEYVAHGNVLPLAMGDLKTPEGEGPTKPFQLVRLRARAADEPAPQPLPEPAAADVLEVAGNVRVPSLAYLRKLVAACQWARIEASVPPVSTLAHALSAAVPAVVANDGAPPPPAPLQLPLFTALSRARVAAQLALLPGSAGPAVGKPLAATAGSNAGARAVNALTDVAHVEALLLRHGASNPLATLSAQVALCAWLTLHAELLSRGGGGWREAVHVLWALVRWADGGPGSTSAASASAPTGSGSGSGGAWSWLQPLGTPPSSQDVIARALAAATASASSSFAPPLVAWVLLSASVRCGRILAAAGCVAAAKQAYVTAREAFHRLAARPACAGSVPITASELSALTGASLPPFLCPAQGAPVALFRGLLVYHFAVHADAVNEPGLVASLVSEELSKLEGWVDACSALVTDGASAGGDPALLRRQYFQAAHILLLVGDRAMHKGQWPAAQLTFERAMECARRLRVLEGPPSGASGAAPAPEDTAAGHASLSLLQPGGFSDVALPSVSDLLAATAMSTAIAYARDGVAQAGAASAPLLDALIRSDPPTFVRPAAVAMLCQLYEAPQPPPQAAAAAAPAGGEPPAASAVAAAASAPALDGKSRRAVLGGVATRFGLTHISPSLFA